MCVSSFLSRQNQLRMYKIFPILSSTPAATDFFSRPSPICLRIYMDIRVSPQQNIKKTAYLSQYNFSRYDNFSI